MATSQRKMAIVTFFMVMIAITTIIAVAEGVVRLRQFLKYGHAGAVQDIYYTDPSMNLRVLIPNLKQSNIQINSIGFRCPELANPKPVSAVRLAFLGGSTTFCAEVSSNEMTWPHLVWKQIQEAKPDIQFDYVNVATPGYTLLSSLKCLRYRLKPLEPDIIVIYHATNDLCKDSRELAIKQGIISQDDIDDRESWLSSYSLLWLILEKNFKIMKIQKEIDTQPKLEFDPESLSKNFRERLTALVTESRKTAKLVALATFSCRIRHEQTSEEQLKAANTALYYMPYMSMEGMLKGYEEYNRIIREVASETGALLIEKEMSIPADDLHFNDSVHFKDPGSRLMAKRISDALLNSADLISVVQQQSTKQIHNQ